MCCPGACAYNFVRACGNVGLLFILPCVQYYNIHHRTQKAQLMRFREGKLIEQKEIQYSVPKAVYIRTRKEGGADGVLEDPDDPSDLSTTLAMGVGEVDIVRCFKEHHGRS